MLIGNRMDGRSEKVRNLYGTDRTNRTDRAYRTDRTNRTYRTDRTYRINSKAVFVLFVL